MNVIDMKANELNVIQGKWRILRSTDENCQSVIDAMKTTPKSFLSSGEQNIHHTNHCWSVYLNGDPITVSDLTEEKARMIANRHSIQLDVYWNGFLGKWVDFVNS